MKHYVELERKVIESMTNKGHQTPYETRLKSLLVQSYLTGFSSFLMFLTYVYMGFFTHSGGGLENMHNLSIPFFIMLVAVSFTSRKRMHAIEQLQMEQVTEPSL